MHTSNSTPENDIGSPSRITKYISGPHWEPPTVPNATTYWRCRACHRESIYERDLYQDSFHTPDCEVRQ